MTATFLALAAGVQADERLIDSGTWTKGGYEVAGEWRLIQDGDRRFVELGEGFQTKRAPDLKLFLSPLPEEEIGDGNATDGSVLIAALTSHDGAQRYEIDPEVDLAEFSSLIIHCQQYSKYWAGTALEPDE